ncbi:Hypothetical predicted protein, partial [Pelobates cultripes]
ARNIRYRWGVPFALIVNIKGTTHSLSTYQDVAPFTKAFDLKESNIMDWYAPDPLASSAAQPYRPRWRTPSKKQKIGQTNPSPREERRRETAGRTKMQT